MNRPILILFCILLAPVLLLSQQLVFPTIITNHYDSSEPESHGVVTVDKEWINLSVRDLSKNKEYQVILLNEMTGERKLIGSIETGGKGDAKAEFDATGLLNSFNALLVMNDEDVIQYAQLQDSHHGCICRHSGGTIVTQRLEQECYECPCGVKYEICCGGPKKH